MKALFFAALNGKINITSDDIFDIPYKWRLFNYARSPSQVPEALFSSRVRRHSQQAYR
jgi:hypothetical protein